MTGKFTVHEDYSKRPAKDDNRRCWVESCGWHLHSNGKVYLRAPEFFPTRKDAEDLLAKFPDAKIPEPERDWKNGDVFILAPENDSHSHTMIFIKRVNSAAGNVYCLDYMGCDMDHKTDDFLRDAKFLYNVNEHLECMRGSDRQ